MSGWFRSRRQVTAPSDAGPASSEFAVQKALALNILLNQIRPDRKTTILDLGPAVGQNLDALSVGPCRFYIEDLFETLNSFDYLAPEDGFSLETVFSYLLPFPKHCRFDLILAWDIPNYLERESFRCLMLHLGRFCRPGTLLYCLISTGKLMPESPYRFRIMDTETLVYENRSSVLRTSPRYEATDLGQAMPRFRVYSSFVLRNGYREYLFMFE